MPEQDNGGNEESYGRPIWTGTISFGLVNVPVGIYAATRPNNIPLRMVNAEGRPLKRQYFTARDEKPLEWEEIVRGYEIEKDDFVPLDDEELERVAPEKTGGIDLRRFVDAKEIDPMYFERGYFLVPDGNNTKAYRLLAQVMSDTGLAGMATFVMRAKEYIAAIFADHGILRLETLRFADELRTPETIGLPKPGRVAETEVKKVERAIAKLTEEKFSERELVDRSMERLREVIQKKLDKGEDVVELPAEARDEEPPANTLDLMAALERSLSKGGGAKKTGRKRATRRKKSAA